MMRKTLLLVGILASQSVLAQSGEFNIQGDWKVVGWDLPDYVPVKGFLPILKFKANTVSGTAGCNNISGTFGISGSDITFSQLGTTRKACSEAAMQAETLFLKALSGKTLTAKRVADSLTFALQENWSADDITKRSTIGSIISIRRMTIQSK